MHGYQHEGVIDTNGCMIATYTVECKYHICLNPLFQRHIMSKLHIRNESYHNCFNYSIKAYNV